MVDDGGDVLVPSLGFGEIDGGSSLHPQRGLASM
jgi:hypothetical protein